tara:strand:- start:6162 stop:7229 length:1068 start_codon:yes stop_codon:yes gene_type:complete
MKSFDRTAKKQTLESQIREIIPSLHKQFKEAILLPMSDMSHYDRSNEENKSKLENLNKQTNDTNLILEKLESQHNKPLLNKGLVYTTIDSLKGLIYDIKIEIKRRNKSYMLDWTSVTSEARNIFLNNVGQIEELINYIIQINPDYTDKQKADELAKKTAYYLGVLKLSKEGCNTLKELYNKAHTELYNRVKLEQIEFIDTTLLGKLTESFKPYFEQIEDKKEEKRRALSSEINESKTYTDPAINALYLLNLYFNSIWINHNPQSFKERTPESLLKDTMEVCDQAEERNIDSFLEDLYLLTHCQNKIVANLLKGLKIKREKIPDYIKKHNSLGFQLEAYFETRKDFPNVYKFKQDS